MRYNKYHYRISKRVDPRVKVYVIKNNPRNMSSLTPHYTLRHETFDALTVIE